MFGYVLPAKSEMKMREFEEYRAYYCGLCKQLQKSYGAFSRLLLNYDLVLLALVADALRTDKGQTKVEGCIAGPWARHPTLHNTLGLQLGADGLILLSFYRLKDNLMDERGIKRLGYWLAYPLFRRWQRKAAAKNSALDVLLKQLMEQQAALEAAHCTNVDEACEPTAKMCAALFAMAAQNNAEERILYRLGLFAGQVVYLLDAAEDYQKDAAKGRYNVYVEMGLPFEEAVQAAQTRCRMAAGEIARCYNLLDIKTHKPILDNVFFLGLPAGIAAAGQKRTGRTPKHGQIDSV